MAAHERRACALVNPALASSRLGFKPIALCLALAHVIWPYTCLTLVALVDLALAPVLRSCSCACAHVFRPALLLTSYQPVSAAREFRQALWHLDST